ncbi:hypothetical protein LTR17_017888 [Elasticomyces elasticus]|nr:hypothetical protein LTR17_017888 [Elasticomyces elasticus]
MAEGDQRRGPVPASMLEKSREPARSMVWQSGHETVAKKPQSQWQLTNSEMHDSVAGRRQHSCEGSICKKGLAALSEINVLRHVAVAYGEEARWRLSNP